MKPSAVFVCGGVKEATIDFIQAASEELYIERHEVSFRQ